MIGKGKAPSEKFTAAEVTALRRSLEQQSQLIQKQTTQWAKQIQSGEPLSIAQSAEMQQMLDRLAATENLISGAAHDAAVLLNALKIPIDSEFAQSRTLAKLARDGGGPETLGQKVLAIAEAGKDGDPTKILSTALESRWDKVTKAVLKWRYNSMLSSVRTHMANVSGSGLMGLYETGVVKNLAAFNDLLMTGGGKWASRGYTFADNRRGVQNAVANMGMAFKTAKDIAVGNTVPDDAGKFLNEYGMRINPVRKPVPGGNPGEYAPMTKWETAKAIGNTPTRLLEAEDAWFRSVFYQQSLAEQASIRARELFPGDAAAQERAFKSMVDGAAPEEMKEAAKQYAAKLTFTNDPSIYGKLLGTFGKNMSRLQNEVPGMKLLMPFVSTPVNLMNYSLEVTGIGQILAPNKTYKALFGTDKAARAEALARIEIAVGLGFLTGQLVDDGILTGIGSSGLQSREDAGVYGVEGERTARRRQLR